MKSNTLERPAVVAAREAAAREAAQSQSQTMATVAMKKILPSGHGTTTERPHCFQPSFFSEEDLIVAPAQAERTPIAPIVPIKGFDAAAEDPQPDAPIQPAEQPATPTIIGFANIGGLPAITPAEAPAAPVQPAAPATPLRSPVDDYKNAADALMAIQVPQDYDEFRRVACAAKAAGVSEFDFMAWARQGAKFDEDGDRTIWDGIEADGGITAGTLYYLAKESGWRSTAIRPIITTSNTAPATEDPQETPEHYKAWRLDLLNVLQVPQDMDAFIDVLRAAKRHGIHKEDFIAWAIKGGRTAALCDARWALENGAPDTTLMEMAREAGWQPPMGDLIKAGYKPAGVKVTEQGQEVKITDGHISVNLATEQTLKDTVKTFLISKIDNAEHLPNMQPENKIMQARGLIQKWMSMHPESYIYWGTRYASYDKNPSYYLKGTMHDFEGLKPQLYMLLNPLSGTERRAEKVKQGRVLLLELDEQLVSMPLLDGTHGFFKATGRNGHELGAMELDGMRRQQACIWDAIRASGILPLYSLIYSGGKSIHALCRVNYTVDEFDGAKNTLTRLYKAWGFDAANLELSRMTRALWGQRRFKIRDDGALIDCEGPIHNKDHKAWGDYFKDHGGDEAAKAAELVEREQALLYLNEDVEPMTMDAFIDALKDLTIKAGINADTLDRYLHPETATQSIMVEIERVKAEAAAQGIKVDAPLPMVHLQGAEKPKFVPALWRQWCESIGVGYVSDDYGQRLIIRGDNGYREVTPQEAFAYNVQEMTKVDAALGAAFQFQTIVRIESISAYANNKTALNIPQDTKAGGVYVPFKNGMLVITADKIVMYDDYMDYDTPDIENWRDESGRLIGRELAPTKARDFEAVPGISEFEIFLENACGKLENNPEWQARKDAIMTCIGYNVSGIREKDNPMCIFTEETMSEADGGTGKSLIMKALGKWRLEYALTDMKAYERRDTRFMLSGMPAQTHIVRFDELPKYFDFQTMFGMASDAWNFERKGKDMITIPADKAPKMVFGTNYFPQGDGNSFLRRFRIYEVSNHYRDIEGGVAAEFGHRLFDDWDAAEWQRYDNFIVRCVQAYLQRGLLECKCHNIDEKRLFANFDEVIIEWLTDNIFTEKNTQPNVCIKGGALVADFMRWYECRYGQRYTRPLTSRRMALALRRYAEIYGYDLDHRSDRAGWIWTITRKK